MSWPYRKISDFCETGSGGTPSRKEKAFYENGTIPWVKSGELRENVILNAGEKITSIAVEKSSAKVVPAGAILLAMYGANVGRLAKLGVEATTNQAVCNIRPDPNVADADYMFRFLQSEARGFLNKAAGGAQPNISQGIIRDTLVPLPPLAEQKRIAVILDKADAIRRKREKAIALTDTLLKSVFLDMFGDPVTNPKGWETRPFKELCSRVTVGIVVKPASYYKSRGIPAIRSQNIKEGYIRKKNFVYFSLEDNETKLRKTRVWENDLLIVRTGQPGKAAIVQNDLNGVNAIDVLIATPLLKRVVPKYIEAFFNSSGGRTLVMSEERGQIQKHLNVKSLASALIPHPPIRLQNEYVRIVTSHTKIIENQKTGLKNVDLLATSLTQRAFRGELTPSDLATLDAAE